ncbi:MAG: hypothetical protein LBQ46_04535 [Treponema sp.]|jgi:hypothetical protein|nr:hypothetical protein [Treponema sp.]
MKRLALIALILSLGVPLFGAEYEDGGIRLVLDPLLGRFSLYSLTDPFRQSYEPLFMDQDPRTSVLTFSYNGKPYRLGEAKEFKISEGGTAQAPELIFESSFARVTVAFTFIATAGSATANGVKISFHLENKGRRLMRAGLRFLLDTKLGETSAAPFTTDRRNIEEETVFDGSSDDIYWISGTSEGPSLMGSLGAGVDRAPDSVHIANWKRLNEVPWALDFVQGRRFNNPPYSIRDSAVAYYYEPLRIGRGERSSFYLLLASWDAQGFAAFRPSPGLSGPDSSARGPAADPSGLEPEDPWSWDAGRAGSYATSIPRNMNPAIVRSDHRALRDIIERIEGYLESGVPMSDDELNSIEQDLARIRSRYTGP